MGDDQQHANPQNADQHTTDNEPANPQLAEDQDIDQDELSKYFEQDEPDHKPRGDEKTKDLISIRALKHNVYPDTKLFLSLNAKLAQKKADVISKTGMIEKKGKNDRFGYEYAREADYLNHVRKAMADSGVVFTYTIVEETMEQHSKTSGGNIRWRNRQVIEMTITDMETGFAETAEVVTYGIDSGDKGVWKGITGAVKYYLAKTFLIPTGDDPENDGGVKMMGDTGKEKMYTYAENKGIGKQDLDRLIADVLRLDPNEIPVPQSKQIRSLIDKFSEAREKGREEVANGEVDPNALEEPEEDVTEDLLND